MKRLVLIAISAWVVLPCPVFAFEGLTEKEAFICRGRAAKEINEFSAKQTYEFCSKNIRSEIEERVKNSLFRQKVQEKLDKGRRALAEDISKRCKKHRSHLIHIDEHRKKFMPTIIDQIDSFYFELEQVRGIVANTWDTYPDSYFPDKFYLLLVYRYLREQRQDLLEKIIPLNVSQEKYDSREERMRGEFTGELKPSTSFVDYLDYHNDCDPNKIVNLLIKKYY